MDGFRVAEIGFTVLLPADVKSMFLDKMVLHPPSVDENFQPIHTDIGVDGSFEPCGECG
ncbi:MAG: hypothetical protein K6F10_03245 [Paludibacteraceae bacterium]|nr:hypothetical protein [Paludibacteraceae bacterium]